MKKLEMTRRSLLAAAAASLPVPLMGACATKGIVAASTTGASATPSTPSATITRPLRVGFAITEGFTVIDMTGPWETFQDAHVPDAVGFDLGVVAPTREAVEGSGGMRIQPRWSFADAPALDIVVVGAQKGGPALHEWLRGQAKTARIVMSVCTGAFQLARAGLLAGKSATTHHDFYDKFEREFSNVKLVRGPRFVDEGAVCSAGGLTSGIDLALHVVARLFGDEASRETAKYMEFTQGDRPT